MRERVRERERERERRGEGERERRANLSKLSVVYVSHTVNTSSPLKYPFMASGASKSTGLQPC